MNNSELPVFSSRPDHDDDEKSEISSNEDKNLLSIVRFSSLVDSRRISKDYYSLLQQNQENHTTPSTPTKVLTPTRYYVCTHKPRKLRYFEKKTNSDRLTATSKTQLARLNTYIYVVIGGTSYKTCEGATCED